MVDARVGPIVCVQWLVRCKTSVGCSDPIAASSQAALEEELRREQGGLLVEAGRTAAAEDSPGAGSPGLEGGSLDPEEDNPDPGEGSLALEAGSLGVGHLDSGFRSMNRKVNGHRGQPRLGHHWASLEEEQSESLTGLGFGLR